MSMLGWLADLPEFTKPLYLTPSHFDHFSSNSRTFFDCVRMGISFWDRNETTAPTSSLEILLDMSGQPLFFSIFMFIIYHRCSPHRSKTQRNNARFPP